MPCSSEATQASADLSRQRRRSAFYVHVLHSVLDMHVRCSSLVWLLYSAEACFGVEKSAR